MNHLHKVRRVLKSWIEWNKQDAFYSKITYKLNTTVRTNTKFRRPVIPKRGKTDTSQESHSRVSTILVIFMLGINCVKSNNLYMNLCGSTEKEEIVCVQGNQGERWFLNWSWSICKISIWQWKKASLTERKTNIRGKVHVQGTASSRMVSSCFPTPAHTHVQPSC